MAIVGQHVGDRWCPSCVGFDQQPVTPSTTLLRWPRMSVATAGVPQAAASVRLSPHPSASEPLTTSHARRYSAHQGRGGRSGRANVIQSAAPAASIRCCELLAQRSVADDRQPSARARRRRASTRGVDHELEPLDRRQPADGDQRRVGASCSPPGEKNVVDAVREGLHAIGAEAELEQLVAGGVGRASPSARAGRTAGRSRLEHPPERRPAGPAGSGPTSGRARGAGT